MPPAQDAHIARFAGLSLAEQADGHSILGQAARGQLAFDAPVKSDAPRSARNTIEQPPKKQMLTGAEAEVQAKADLVGEMRPEKPEVLSDKQWEKALFNAVNSVYATNGGKPRAEKVKLMRSYLMRTSSALHADKHRADEVARVERLTRQGPGWLGHEDPEWLDEEIYHALRTQTQQCSIISTAARGGGRQNVLPPVLKDGDVEAVPFWNPTSELFPELAGEAYQEALKRRKEEEGDMQLVCSWKHLQRRRLVDPADGGDRSELTREHSRPLRLYFPVDEFENRRNRANPTTAMFNDDGEIASKEERQRMMKQQYKADDSLFNSQPYAYGIAPELNSQLTGTQRKKKFTVDKRYLKRHLFRFGYRVPVSFAEAKTADDPKPDGFASNADWPSEAGKLPDITADSFPLRDDGNFIVSQFALESQDRRHGLPAFSRGKFLRVCSSRPDVVFDADGEVQPTRDSTGAVTESAADAKRRYVHWFEHLLEVGRLWWKLFTDQEYEVQKMSQLYAGILSTDLASASDLKAGADAMDETDLAEREALAAQGAEALGELNVSDDLARKRLEDELKEWGVSGQAGQAGFVLAVIERGQQGALKQGGEIYPLMDELSGRQLADKMATAAEKGEALSALELMGLQRRTYTRKNAKGEEEDIPDDERDPASLRTDDPEVQERTGRRSVVQSQNWTWPIVRIGRTPQWFDCSLGVRTKEFKGKPVKSVANKVQDLNAKTYKVLHEMFALDGQDEDLDGDSGYLYESAGLSAAELPRSLRTQVKEGLEVRAAWDYVVGILTNLVDTCPFWAESYLSSQLVASFRQSHETMFFEEDRQEAERLETLQTAQKTLVLLHKSRAEDLYGEYNAAEDRVDAAEAAEARERALADADRLYDELQDAQRDWNECARDYEWTSWQLDDVLDSYMQANIEWNPRSTGDQWAHKWAQEDFEEEYTARTWPQEQLARCAELVEVIDDNGRKVRPYHVKDHDYKDDRGQSLGTLAGAFTFAGEEVVVGQAPAAEFDITPGRWYRQWFNQVLKLRGELWPTSLVTLVNMDEYLGDPARSWYVHAQGRGGEVQRIVTAAERPGIYPGGHAVVLTQVKHDKDVMTVPEDSVKANGRLQVEVPLFKLWPASCYPLERYRYGDQLRIDDVDEELRDRKADSAVRTVLKTMFPDWSAFVYGAHFLGPVNVEVPADVPGQYAGDYRLTVHDRFAALADEDDPSRADAAKIEQAATLWTDVQGCSEPMRTETQKANFIRRHYDAYRKSTLMASRFYGTPDRSDRDNVLPGWYLTKEQAHDGAAFRWRNPDYGFWPRENTTTLPASIRRAYVDDRAATRSGDPVRDIAYAFKTKIKRIPYEFQPELREVETVDGEKDRLITSKKKQKLFDDLKRTIVRRAKNPGKAYTPGDEVKPTESEGESEGESGPEDADLEDAEDADMNFYFEDD